MISHSELVSSNVSVPSVEDVLLLLMVIRTENIVFLGVSESEITRN